MNLLALVNPGLEESAAREVQELVQVGATISPQVLEFSVPGVSEALTLLRHGQCLRRLLIRLGRFTSPEAITFPYDFPWKEYFPSEFLLKIDIERIKGEEVRTEISKQLAGKLFPLVEKLGLRGKIDFKKPNVMLLLFYNGQEYVVGLDCSGPELNARSYRVFPHSASFKGDLGYHAVRFSGFKPQEKLLVGFMKDGVIPIEAALFAHRLPVHRQAVFSTFLCHRFPLFAREPIESKSEPAASRTTEEGAIAAFDYAIQNLTGARKNAILAEVQSVVQMQKIALDDVDVKYGKEQFQRLVFHLTTKDEDRVNELLYQADYVLRPGGTLVLVTRPMWDVPVGRNFTLQKKSIIFRGESALALWCLEKRT